MQVPVDITFRGMTPSPTVEAAIHRWVERLDLVFDRIEHCAVVIEVPHQHHQRGRMFRVRVDLAVPDRTITVSRDPGLDHAHEDVYVAITDAFRAARRQLVDHARYRKLHA
jgi:ribosome-associated translation inhibitor RaiA